MRSRNLQLLLVLVGAAVIAALIASGHFGLRARMDRVVGLVRDEGPLPFFGAMAVLPMVGFPLSAFTLSAGPLFAPTMGVGKVMACGVVAITCNVALSYWISARALRPVTERLINWLGYRLPEIQPRAASSAILILRVVPLTPFWLQSILLGLARVPFGPYMAVSILVPSVYALAAITLGDALMRGDRWAIAGAGALFLVVGCVLHVVRKRLRFAPATAGAAVDHQRS